MTYKEMNDNELIREIIRVKDLLYGKYNSHTYHQNKKYLEKLYIERKRRGY